MGLPPILEVGGILISSDLLTEEFCCDLDVCHGACCVEGDEVWKDLSAQAQSVIDRQGVAYTDQEGDLVTSIVRGKDCVFTCYKDGLCLCALEKAYREGRTHWCKPISCALYPIRAKQFADGTIGLNYNRWKICESGVRKGRELHLPLYRFLEGPLTRRFGEEWYRELCEVADEIQRLL